MSAFRLNALEEQAILRGLKTDADRKNTIQSQVNPQTAQNISDIRQQYPWLPPGVILSAAKGEVSPELLAQMAGAVAIMANDDPDKANGKKKGNWLSNGFKAVTRTAFATFDTAVELFQNAISKTPIPEAAELVGTKVKGATGQLEGGYGAGTPSAQQVLSSASERTGEGGWGDFIGSTSIASLVRNWDDQDGYFISEKARQEQAERARKFRGTTQGGHAWTIGRGGAGMVFTEDSYAYNLMSGAIDGYVAVKMPVAPGAKLALKGVSELAAAEDAGDFLRQAGRVADTLQGKGQVIKLSDMTGEELKEARRIAGLVGNTVDAAQANRFFETRAGRRLVQRLVDANSVDDVWNLLNRNVYGDTVKRLRDAKTEFEVQEVLADVLGKPQVGLSTTKGAKGVRAFSVSNARRLKIMESLDTKVGLKINRGLGYTPGKMIDMSSTNPADVRRTLQQIDNWAKTTLVPETARRQMLDEALDSMVGDKATPTARKAFKDKFEDTVVRSLVENGNTNETAAKVIFGNTRKWLKEARKWSLGPDGVPDDAGFYRNVARVNGEEVSDVAFGGPMLASELADVVIDMPDPRQVRAISNRFNKIWRQKPNIKGEIADLGDENLNRLADAGKLRLPFAAAMWVQDNLFRRLVLMTGGYAVRNLTEAQLRIALSQRDIDGAFIHPMSWIGWATHKKGAFDIKGEAFDYNSLSDNMRIYREAVQAETYTDFGDPAIAYRRGKRLGYFDEAERGNPEQFERVIEAHGDQLGLLNADPVARRIAADASDTEILAFLRTDPEGQRWFRDQQDYHINGRPRYRNVGGRSINIGKQSVDLNDEQNLLYHLKEIRERIDYQTGGDSRLKNVIASGQAPAETVVIAEQKIANRVLGSRITKADEGQVLVLEVPVPGKGKAGTQQVRVISVNEETGEAVIAPFAFARGEATRDLNKLLRDNSVYYNPKLAPILPHEIRMQAPTGPGAKGFEAWDNATDRAFGWLYGKRSRFLDRSPIFRQFYYETAIDQLITSLSREDAIRLYDTIVESAAKTGVSPRRYVGDDARWQRIEDARNGKLDLKGTLTLDEVDDYAKGQALDDLKGLLYDATARRNAVDAARVVFPFANAFVEFYKSIGRAYSVKTMTGIPLPNPASFRKTQLAIEGGREADPDKDGRGYFFVDPDTKEWSFAYPGSSFLTKTLLGVNAVMTAPVSGAIQGIDLGQNNIFGLKVNPGLGPFANIGASLLSKVIPDSDFKDTLEKFFLPYGGTEFSAEVGGAAGGIVKPLVPAWGTKLISAIFDSDESLTAFGNAAFETRQALIASGEYDPNDPEDMERLEADTNFKARWLTVMRAAGQFTGPSRPTPDFKVKAKDGDVFVNQAIADLRRWQEEDYDSATLRFLDTYGEDFWGYLARKTTTDQYEGLGATQEFGQWESENNAFLTQFPTVAAYFAPVGGEFDYFVYSDQLKNGLRRRQSDYDAFNAAQGFSVQAQMRLAEKLVGDNPTPEQEQDLKDYRAALEKEYPGAKLVKFDPTKLQDQIAQLEQAAFMPQMDGNPIAEGTRTYLEQRAFVMAAVKDSGKSITNKDNIGYRNTLRGIASIIIADNPEFQRLWDRVLSRELD